MARDTVMAGKTGTTNDQRDSWFAGMAGNYVGVVWVGRDDNGKMPLTGATGALQVWSDTMSGIKAGSMSFVKPDGVEYHWVEPDTQRLSGEGCPGARYLPYINGSEPRARSSCYRAKGQEVVDWFKDIFGL
jgi:penicillin-binding protein 1B